VRLHVFLGRGDIQFAGELFVVQLGFVVHEIGADPSLFKGNCRAGKNFLDAVAVKTIVDQPFLKRIKGLRGIGGTNRRPHPCQQDKEHGQTAGH
jgi:hypothetical protein